MVLAGQAFASGVRQNPPHHALQCLLNKEIVTHEIRRHREALNCWNQSDGGPPAAIPDPQSGCSTARRIGSHEERNGVGATVVPASSTAADAADI
jgi:hypothetical protein